MASSNLETHLAGQLGVSVRKRCHIQRSMPCSSRRNSLSMIVPSARSRDAARRRPLRGCSCSHPRDRGCTGSSVLTSHRGFSGFRSSDVFVHANNELTCVHRRSLPPVHRCVAQRRWPRIRVRCLRTNREIEPPNSFRAGLAHRVSNRLDAQPFDALEVAAVVREERDVVAEGGSSDQDVEIGDDVPRTT